MYYGWEEEKKVKNNVPVICMTHEITGQERLKWSNKACGHKGGEEEGRKKVERPRLINQCNVLRRVPPHEVSQPIRLK